MSGRVFLQRMMLLLGLVLTFVGTSGPARAEINKICSGDLHIQAHFHDLDGNEVSLSFTRALGSDKMGDLYELADAQGIELPSLPKDLNWAVSVPRRFSKSTQIRNFELDQYVHQNILAIEKSFEFPWHHEWIDHFVPVIPYLHILNTGDGLVTFKPEVTGKSVADLLRENRGHIPHDIQDSARHIFRFGQAVHDQLRASGLNIIDPFGIGSHKISLNLSAENLLWVHEPAQLHFLGMEKPGFILKNLYETVSDRYIAPSKSENKYLEEIFSGDSSLD